MVNEGEEATIDQSVDNEASEDNTIEGKASSIQVKPLFNTVISFDNLALDESEALDFELALHLKPIHLKKVADYILEITVEDLIFLVIY